MKDGKPVLMVMYLLPPIKFDLGKLNTRLFRNHVILQSEIGSGFFSLQNRVFKFTCLLSIIMNMKLREN